MFQHVAYSLLGQTESEIMKIPVNKRHSLLDALRLDVVNIAEGRDILRFILRYGHGETPGVPKVIQ